MKLKLNTEKEDSCMSYKAAEGFIGYKSSTVEVYVTRWKIFSKSKSHAAPRSTNES